MIAALVLAYNEEKYLESNLLEIQDFFEKVIVINDGSKDKTLKIINKFNDNDKFLCISNPKNLGAGKSLEVGISVFNNLGYDYLIKIDGDGQFKIEDIRTLIELSSENYDFIKCDRFWDKGIEGNIPFIRFIGNSIATLFIKIATGNWKINDPLNGLFLFSKKSLNNFYIPNLFKRYGYPFFINVYMNRKILSENLKLGQVKNTVKYREEESGLKPSIMFIKLIFFTLSSYLKKIKEKFKYSSLQLSALLDSIFVFFIGITTYSLMMVFSIILGLSNKSRASWLFLTILLLILGLISFFYSQLYEKKVYNKNFTIL